MFSELISDRIWRKQIHNPAYYRHVAKHNWPVEVSGQWQHRMSILLTCLPTYPTYLPTYAPFSFLSSLINFS
jgi:hypothetical protein